jgi:hypothetical protein
MLVLTLRWNYDNRQTSRVQARTVKSLQTKVRAICMREQHGCDGLTLGDPDDESGDDYVIVLSHNESDDSWECERTRPIGLMGRGPDDWIEYGTFAEMIQTFIDALPQWIADH